MRRLSTPWQAKRSCAAACNVAVPLTASGPQYLQPAHKKQQHKPWQTMFVTLSTAIRQTPHALAHKWCGTTRAPA